MLVRVDGVGKKFCRSLKKSLWYGVCDIAGELLPGRKRQRVAGSELRVAREEAEVAGSELPVASENTSAEGASGPATSYPPLVTSPTGEASLRDGEFWAVRDVSFELRRGECLGLIGHNGAGKTTLLKMLNGLIKPDAGSITMRGRVGALIALGAGFNPILTGRENIYINGSVLGLTKKEIDAKIDEIIDFAEIREFIDMPVQSYSSGMSVRLGFAVAANLEPDILILDEVLAVGDINFRNKCYNIIGELRKKAAVILVTHNLNHVSSICSCCILLEKGQSIGVQSVDKCINEFHNKNEKNQSIVKNGFEYFDDPIVAGKVNIIKSVINYGEDLELEINLCSKQNSSENSLRIILYTNENNPIIDWSSKRSKISISLNKGVNKIAIKTGPINLRKGIYKLNIVLSDYSGLKSIYWSFLMHEISVNGSLIGGNVQLPVGSYQIYHTNE